MSGQNSESQDPIPSAHPDTGGQPSAGANQAPGDADHAPGEASQASAEAIRELEAALARDPHQLEARELLGALLCQSGDVERGIEILESVVDEHPLLVPAHFNLAAACHQCGRLLDAHRHLEVALRLDPHYERALAAQAAWAGDFAPESAPPSDSEAQGTELDSGPDSLAGPDPLAGSAAEAPAAEALSAEAATAEAVTAEAATAEAATAEAPAAVTPPVPLSDAASAADEAARDLPPVPEQSAAASPPIASPDDAAEPSDPVQEAPAAAEGNEVDRTVAIEAQSSETANNATESKPAGTALPAPPGTVDALPPGSSSTKEKKPPEPPVPEWLAAHETYPGLFDVLSGLWLRPSETLQTTWPQFSAAPTAPVHVDVTFVVAALLWAGCWAFDPGGSGSISMTSSLLALVAGLIGAGIVVGLETLVFALAVPAGTPFGDRFRQILPVFAMAWAAANVAVLLPGVFLVAAHLLSALLFVTIAMIWAFVLTLVAATTLFGVDFGRAFVLLLVAQLAGNAAAIALVSAVR